ncbi:MAG: dienelactone hydrolase family protein [Steroidobacteraceae bacterium]
MCDQDAFNDMDEAARRAGGITRRHFGALTLASSFLLLLPKGADAAELKEEEINIKTPDGVADSYFVHPASGKYPGVLMWTDIMGLRPAFKMMAQRLAMQGYSVLVPNPFYRKAKAPIVPAGAGMQDEATRKVLMDMMGSLTADTNVTDAKAFVAFLDAQPSVDKKRKIGTCGYCMGGPLVMRTAATFPDRIGAAATFHGANLASDKPDSPHLLIPKMKSSFLIAIAESDDMRDPQAKVLLREAFDKTRLPAEIEVYAGTQHGWCPPDSQVYNEAAAEKAWSRLLALYGKALA